MRGMTGGQTASPVHSAHSLVPASTLTGGASQDESEGEGEGGQPHRRGRQSSYYPYRKKTHSTLDGHSTDGRIGRRKVTQTTCGQVESASGFSPHPSPLVGSGGDRSLHGLVILVPGSWEMGRDLLIGIAR
ncbi:hypothetical protein CMUS01_00552 [Colletotrichum musicola]|uniref:Uncharacterized protein n=1 Tax=Colletotrichum musicola TaxID=2175873 RepID=A0A8H6NYY0_9PEZI|nr:hypothetical protein CMUS01_00552 [Colletotrichum musicola]